MAKCLIIAGTISFMAALLGCSRVANETTGTDHRARVTPSEPALVRTSDSLVDRLDRALLEAERRFYERYAKVPVSTSVALDEYYAARDAAYRSAAEAVLSQATTDEIRMVFQSTGDGLLQLSADRGLHELYVFAEQLGDRVRVIYAGTDSYCVSFQ